MSIQHGTSTSDKPPVAAIKPRITRLSPGSGIFELSLPSSSSFTTTTSSSSSSSGLNDKPQTNLDTNSTKTKSRFSTLSAAYPLKLLTPTSLPSQPYNINLLYTLAYGGGLVSNDLISLRGSIGRGCGLVMLTQGSTKVYKKRGGIRPKSDFRSNKSKSTGSGEGVEEKEEDITKQRLHITLHSNSFLLLLPDSISPFKKSKYSQIQRFNLPLDGTASLLVLDWVNSGRGQRQFSPSGNLSQEGEQSEDEIWSMDYYSSINEIYLGEELIMREKMILSNTPTTSSSPSSPSLSSIAQSLAPYNVYATILFTGPHLEKLLRNLKIYGENYRQYQIKSPQDLIWSFSELPEGGKNSGIIRIATKEIELVRYWLRDLLGKSGIGDLVGEGVWPRCI